MLRSFGCRIGNPATSAIARPRGDGLEGWGRQRRQRRGSPDEPVVRPAWTGRDRQPAAIHPLVSTSPGNGNEHELQPAGDARFYGVSLALAKRRWTGPVEVSCLSSPSVRGLSLRARRAPSRVTMGALRRSWSSRAKRLRSKIRRGRSSRRATGRLARPRTGHASRKLASSQVCDPLPLIIRPPPPADRPFRPTLTQ